MFFKIHVLHIEEARAVYGVGEEEAEARRNLVEEACRSYGFELTLMPIEKIFEVQRDSRNEQPEDLDHAKFKRLNPEVPIDCTAKLEQPDLLD